MVPSLIWEHNVVTGSVEKRYGSQTRVVRALPREAQRLAMVAVAFL